MFKKHFKLGDYENYLIDRLKIENDKQSKIINRVSIQFGIISLIFLTLKEIIQKFPYLESTISYTFFIFFFSTLLFIGISLFFLLISIWPLEIAYPPKIIEINNIYEEKKAYFKSKKIRKTEKQVSDMVLEEFRESYAESIDYNSDINIRRSNKINSSVYFLFCGIIGFIICYILYFNIPEIDFQKKIHQIKVIK